MKCRDIKKLEQEMSQEAISGIHTGKTGHLDQSASEKGDEK